MVIHYDQTSDSIPTGTVTFLFTDIEGSTQLAQRYSEALPYLLDRHNTILYQSIQENNGYVFRTIGDAFCAAFQTAPEALNAAVKAQHLLQHEAWDPAPIRVRMGIHTGAALASVIDDRAFDDRSYLTLARVQSIMSSASGGQVLISNTSADLARDHLPPGISLRDMGEHQLRSGLEREHLWQVVAEDLQREFPPLKTMNLLPNNLPLQLKPFFGREPEMAQMRELLASTRLLTLVGPGGIGKTRLALQAAESLLPEFPQGAWFVPLDPLTSANFLPEAIGSALGLSFSGLVPPREQLLEWLRNKNSLLVLDNFEHLLPEGANVLIEILQKAPGVKMLVTSRQVLNLQAEWILDLHGLDYPKDDEEPTLLVFPAAALFLQHARRASGRMLLEDELSCVAHITRLVEGAPLALELAAGWARALTCREIAVEIERELDFLQTNQPDLPERHRSMRAVFDHSWQLLSVEERAAFRRLAVFRGGFDREAAREVAGASLGSLAALVDKSLLQHQPDGRYRIHELLRQFGAAELERTGDVESTRERYLAYFLALAERAGPELRGAQEKAWLDRLESENDNLRAALEWSLSPKSKLGVRAGMNLMVAIEDFWMRRGHINEGVEWLVGLLEQPHAEQHPKVYANALRLSAYLKEWGPGKVEAARTDLERSLAIAETEQDSLLLAQILSDFGNYYMNRGELGEAQKYLERSLALFHELRNEPGIARVLRRLGHIQSSSNNRSSARTYYQQSLQAWRNLGNRSDVAWTLYELGRSHILSGQFAEARTCLEECLAIGRELIDWFVIIYCTDELGTLEYLEGEVSMALVYLEESLGLARDAGMKRLISVNLGYLGDIACYQGDYSKAHAFYQEALEAIHEIKAFGPDLQQHLLLSEGFAYFHQGDSKLAHKFFKESWSIRQELLDDSWLNARFLTCAAGISVSKGHPERAARWLGVAQAVIEENAFPFIEKWWYYPDYERILSLVGSQIDEESYNRLNQEGRSVVMKDLEQILLEVMDSL